MRYIATAVTDIGISKKTNQDSVCIKIADTDNCGQIAMVVLCDGMGGLEKGEVASATVVKAFISWFENELPSQLKRYSWKLFAQQWADLIKKENDIISDFGRKNDVSLGTTVTAILFIEGKYLIAHVGDSRVYEIGEQMKILTEDQTFVAREVKRGNMTAEQAERDSRRSVLLQCVGASRVVEPQILFGKVVPSSVYMICSDGLRHVLTSGEINAFFNSTVSVNEGDMATNSRKAIDLVKSRQEKDNITVALIKCIK